MQNLDLKIELWKKRLLDLGKRNRLINFRETKRSNIAITSPSLCDIFKYFVLEEKSLSFSYPSKTIFDENGDEQGASVIEGEIKTNQKINEQQRTLKSIRTKAKTSIEEQGINTLYLTFGIIKWNTLDNDEEIISSPIVLVPVNLKIETINSPYVLSLGDDEIVINPNLVYKLENDFGIKLPEFNEHKDEIENYLSEIEKIIAHNGWEVKNDVYLSLLSFLKMNMYVDLNKNRDKIISNPVIKALTGDLTGMVQVSEELNHYDHDRNTRPLDTFQVVDADSSQQDAILFSKKGISFVLQGPPGTGKSQTITNIIAEAIADGKKVLFVSEKMAALEVVKKRLEEANLEDFCLTLHSYKASKRDVLNKIEDTLNLPKQKVQDEMLYKLAELEEKRKHLNEYHQELHTKCMPLNATIYEINGKLAKLDSTEDLVFYIENLENTDNEKLNRYKYLIEQYANARESINKCSDNPWIDSNIIVLTHDLRNNIESKLNQLIPNFKNFVDVYDKIIQITSARLECTVDNVEAVKSILNLCIKSPGIPADWLKSDFDEMIALANQMSFKCSQYYDIKEQLKKKYASSVFDISAEKIYVLLEKEMQEIKNYIDFKKYNSNKEIAVKAGYLSSECRSIKDLLSSCFERSEALCEAIGIGRPDSIDSLIYLDELASYVVKNPRPSEKWFNEIQLADAEKILTDARQHQLLLRDGIGKIKLKYVEKIIDIDYKKFVERFSEYKNVISLIASFFNTENNIDKKLIDSFERDENHIILRCKNIIEKAFIASDRVAALINTKKIRNIEELISLGKLTGAISNNTVVSEAWFDIKNDAAVENIINSIKSKQNQNVELTNQILSKFSIDILNIDYKGMLSRFNTEYIGFLKHAKGGYKADKKAILSCSKELNNKISDEDIVSLLSKISSIKENENWLNANYQIAHELIGNLYLENLTDWNIVEKSRENFSIIKNYFGNIGIPNSLKKILTERNYEEILDECESINELSLVEVAGELKRIMKAEISDCTIEEVLLNADEICKSTVNMKNDFDVISNYLINTDENLKVEDVTRVLSEIKEVNECKNWFKEKNYLLGEYLGNNYIGEDTDFDDIKNNIGIVNKIKLLLNNNISEQFSSMLKLSKFSEDEFKAYQDSMRNLEINNVCERLDSILNLNNIKSVQEVEIYRIIDKVEISAKLINNSFEEFTSKAKDKLQFETIMSDIVSLNKIQRLEQLFRENEQDFIEKFSSYYSGTATDWVTVAKNLEYAKELKNKCDEFTIDEKFSSTVCNNAEMIVILKNYLEELSSYYDLVHGDIKWLEGLFASDISLNSMELHYVYDKINNLTNLSMLEDWIDFCVLKNQCAESGLKDFVEKIEQSQFYGKDILNIFLKRFYKLWLDSVLPKFPAVFSFRSRTQQSVIDDFNQLDLMQLEIARLRIREKLIDRLPDINVATSSLDEFGILKRELSKQRRIMPLRKLFDIIPGLLTTLKPCLMMSPLSVSLYLSTDVYDFDIVIFDEASQICTEDAIGALIRGKQVIIAGDRFQLPPTSFFNATYTDNSFDIDYEDSFEELDAYDSILDEASNVMPEKTLKWHYRSRYENLITFSNAKIYKNELITFPSNVDNIPDSGVEYVYVEDGRYDRGSRKNNLNEAKCVADLVFEHLKKHPKRSLGVVTFSEAQQQAIENAIRKKRIEDSSYEDFFNEEIEEDFFVKNLENVQGDERDTIILSIGYGKDANGVMYMNFGPLSRNGGYRRLNVAITRAKYNLKLVGSIRPEDINLDKTNSEGVRLLKNYIEYAIYGQKSLTDELILRRGEENDSQFEEAIGEFLMRNGYDIKTHVGSSNYRIDMAVKHPFVRETFVLGIECDGESYHMTRTERERDRLRHSVLIDMGWNIYRVWSTDWIKDMKTEGEKLLRAVKKAILNYDAKYGENSKEELKNSFLPCQANSFKIEDEEISYLKHYNPYNFDIYEETDVFSFNTKFDDNKYFIEEVIKKESPIHFDLLCKRVAVLFGYMKVTSKVRNEVESIVDNNLKLLVTRKGEFYYYNDAEIKPRIPALNKPTRSINYISIEEIAAAMMVIAEKMNVITRNDLCNTTAVELGYVRAGANIIQTMENACEYLLKNNMVYQSGEMITIF